MRSSRGRPRSCRSTSPPSATRVQRWPGTLAYQIAPSASAQMPSGAEPGPRSAHTRRSTSSPESVIVHAVSRSACDSASTSVSSPRTTIPFGNHTSSATWRLRAVGQHDGHDARLAAPPTACDAGHVDPGTAGGVDDDLVERLAGGAVRRPGPDRRPHPPRRGGDESAVGQPVDRERQPLDPGHDLAVPVAVEGQHLAGHPVAHPEPAVVPPRGLAHLDPGQRRGLSLAPVWCTDSCREVSGTGDRNLRDLAVAKGAPMGVDESLFRRCVVRRASAPGVPEVVPILSRGKHRNSRKGAGASWRWRPTSPGSDGATIPSARIRCWRWWRDS